MSKLGCIKDKLDDRDYLMRAYLPVIKLPKKIDYTPKLSPVRDQGDEGTCVSFACATGMKEYQELLDYKKLVELSPRFVYSECKKIDGMPDEEGTTIRAAMQILESKGVCQEKFCVMTYARILNLNELRLSLASNGPCVIGVEVFEGMMKTKTGIVPMPKKNETALGGHAICPIGYDDTKKVIKFKNSWSDEWGERGYGFLPYAYIERYMMDAWSSVDIDDPNPLTLESVLKYKEKAIV